MDQFEKEADKRRKKSSESIAVQSKEEESTTEESIIASNLTADTSSVAIVTSQNRESTETQSANHAATLTSQMEADATLNIVNSKDDCEVKNGETNVSKLEYQIETIINSKPSSHLHDVVVMGDSMVRLASQVVGELKDCTYYYPGMRLEPCCTSNGKAS